MAQREIRDIINLIVSIIALLIPTIIFILTSPEKITLPMIITFSIIGIFLLVFSFSIYFYSRWRGLCREVVKNKRENEEIKKLLNLNKLFSNMDVRLKVLESLVLKGNKKGQQIDPRIIYWIIILILLYLFLKFAGIVP